MYYDEGYCFDAVQNDFGACKLSRYLLFNVFERTYNITFCLNNEIYCNQKIDDSIKYLC